MLVGLDDKDRAQVLDDLGDQLVETNPTPQDLQAVIDGEMPFGELGHRSWLPKLPAASAQSGKQNRNEP
jgi:hypothetical protein